MDCRKGLIPEQCRSGTYVESMKNDIHKQDRIQQHTLTNVLILDSKRLYCVCGMIYMRLQKFVEPLQTTRPEFCRLPSLLLLAGLRPIT